MRRPGVGALARVFGGGPAHAASRHWCAQRFTAIALVPLTIWFLISLLTLPDLTYGTVHAWVAGRWTATLLCLLVVAMLWHSHSGVREVVADYVHHRGAHRGTLVLSTFLHLLFGAAAVLSILKIALPGSHLGGA